MFYNFVRLFKRKFSNHFGNKNIVKILNPIEKYNKLLYNRFNKNKGRDKMVREYFKSQKGITIVSLVVTIILLLILAGITIIGLIGENGLLNKTKEAKKNQLIADELEKIKLSVLTTQSKLEGKLTKSELEQTMSAEFGKDIILNGEDTWIYEGEYKDYFIFQDGRIEEKEDYSQLSIGDYVNYNVYYENLNSYNSKYKVKNEYNGWRIISIDKQNNVVKLVSAGIPLTYKYNYGNTSQNVETLTSNFLDDATVFVEYGFKDNDNNLINNTSDMKQLFLNEVTAQKSGSPKVASITKNDLGEKFNGDKWGTFAGEDLFSIPCDELNENEYAPYWLASPYYSQQLWSIWINGKIQNQNSKTLGIRPVVTLVSNIKFERSNESSGNKKVEWNLKL